MAIKPHQCKPGCYHGTEPISEAVSPYPTIPPANPNSPEVRLLRAIFGYCPNHDECTSEDHKEES